jgi:hypothetical protein
MKYPLALWSWTTSLRRSGGFSLGVAGTPSTTLTLLRASGSFSSSAETRYQALV